MKLWKICSILALGAGLLVSCGEDDVLDIATHNVTLTVTPTAQKIATDGSATFTFSVNVISQLTGQEDISKYTATLSFEATGGSVSPASATTDKNGNVSVTFTTPDPQGFTGGTVKGTVKKVQEDKKDGLFQQGDLASATADVLPLDAKDPVTGDEPVDEGLKKANKLGGNEFVIDGKKQVIGEWEDDYIWFGVKKDETGTTRVIYIDFCREHPEYASVSGGCIHITPDMLGKEIDMLADKTGLAWMNLWTLQDPTKPYNSDTNPEFSFSTGDENGKAKLEKAIVKFSQDSQTGACSALAYFKSKDGKEAYCKVNAVMSDPWQQ